MTGHTLGLTALSIAALACSPVPAPDPMPTPPPASVCTGLSDACAAAGCRLEELGCRWADGTPTWEVPGTHEPFESVCRIRATHGVDWRPECIATIIDCSELDDAYWGRVCR